MPNKQTNKQTLSEIDFIFWAFSLPECETRVIDLEKQQIICPHCRKCQLN